MTKKHFEALAKAIKLETSILRDATNFSPTQLAIIETAMTKAVGRVGEEFNPNFDYTRFHAAARS